MSSSKSETEFDSAFLKVDVTPDFFPARYMWSTVQFRKATNETEIIDNAFEAYSLCDVHQ
jgi:hypothetical protein